jgi:hypothetical protein
VTKSWIRPLASCSVAKLALPMMRLSIIRPATETATCCGSSALVVEVAVAARELERRGPSA